jgi:hypothetical protein
VTLLGLYPRRHGKAIQERASGPVGDDRDAGRGYGNKPFRNWRSQLREVRGTEGSRISDRLTWPLCTWPRSPPIVTAIGPDVGVSAAYSTITLCTI